MDKDESREQRDQEISWEDEGNIVLKPWMIPVFAGMLILAILICIPLWKLTHRETSSMPVQTETVEDTSPTATSDGVVIPAAEGLPTAAADGEVTKTTEGSSTGAAELLPEAAVEPVSGDSSMTFGEREESVTAKDVTNLRSAPNTGDMENIVAQLKNGEVLTRIGVNDSTGWSKLEYEGQTVYAVTQYLTTDLDYKTPVAPSNPNRVSTLDGRVILFTDCDDHVTPKEYVNLRTEPSTSEGESTVKCQVNHGEDMHRTGYSPDSGWSRVEYQGQILYVVSSLVQGIAAD